MGSISLARRTVSEDQSGWQMVSICERAAAVTLFTLSLPVTLTSALAIRVLSGRTPLIAHRRIGRRGATLWMLKLRTMWGPDASSDDVCAGNGWIEYIADDHGPERKLENDPRVPGGFAQFLRRHSIDELPQLWHVISGEMSLVGPRPHAVAHDEMYRKLIEDYALRLRVFPGITGWAQINGWRGETRDVRDMKERVRMDLWYIECWSIWLDLFILLQTPMKAFHKKAY